MKQLVIASRESALAMWQAEHIQARLQALYPGLSVSILGMTTQGDQILDKTLSKIGGKGLFVKELEVALQEGRADLAVHSMKDVPMNLPDGFELAAICTREDPRDAFVSNRYAALADLPDGAVVGTSSLRRESQLRARYPHLTIRPLRGNVQTRLRKLDDGEFDAIILAAAGLKRLGLSERIRIELAPQESLPAVGDTKIARSAARVTSAAARRVAASAGAMSITGRAIGVAPAAASLAISAPAWPAGRVTTTRRPASNWTWLTNPARR